MDMRDLAAPGQAERTWQRQNRVLERIATGGSLPSVLEEIVQLAEEQLPGSICSILLRDRAGQRLQFGAGRRLPADYARAIDGLPIGPSSASCGTAAYRREIVMVSDIASDPLWAGHRELALRHGLRGCCSYPILARDPPPDGAPPAVIGTFALYRHETGVPAPSWITVLGGAAHLASVAIGQVNALRALRDSENRYRMLVENANDALFVHDAQGIIRDVNRRACESLTARTRSEACAVAVAGWSRWRLAAADRMTGDAAAAQRAVAQRDSVGDALRVDVAAICDAAERAARLTGQLLAFSRRAIVEPTVLDLNSVVASISAMIRPLIGEDIELTTSFDPALRRVNADRGQIEQLVMNLALNARDAMPDGGRLTIETCDVLRADDTRAYPVHEPARYACLRVTDTGMGMTEAVKARIFEPFFTTKDLGKGTGLGLATVFGIAKQAGGHVDVETAPGKGTTFRVLLPAIDEISAPMPGRHAEAPRGYETVLLAEDEESVRRLAKIGLETQGYTVLEARSGREAIAASQSHDGPLHVLVTDVVMPDFGGREIADRIRALRPGIRVLYTSGYTDDALMRKGVSDDTDAFLQKPFTPQTLASKIRAVLNEA